MSSNHRNGKARRRKPESVKVKAHLFHAGAFTPTEIDWYWAHEESYEEEQKLHLLGWRLVECHFYVPDIFRVSEYAHCVPGQEKDDYPDYDRWAITFCPHSESTYEIVVVQSVPDLMDLKARWWPIYAHEQLDRKLDGMETILEKAFVVFHGHTVKTQCKECNPNCRPEDDVRNRTVANGVTVVLNREIKTNGGRVFPKGTMMTTSNSFDGKCCLSLPGDSEVAVNGCPSGDFTVVNSAAVRKTT